MKNRFFRRRILHLWADFRGIICFFDRFLHEGEKLIVKSLDFLTVYLTIIELVKDGQIQLKQNV